MGRATSGRCGGKIMEACRGPPRSRARWRSSMRRRARLRSPTTTSIDESGRAVVMPVWQGALVLNLTLAVGLGLGYAGWGRRVDALDREFDAARARVEGLERGRQAEAAGPRAGLTPG